MRDHDSAAERFRDLFCAVFCGCDKPRKRAKVTLSFGNSSITFKGDFMATFADSGGPINVDVSAFVDAASNPVNDSDIPVYAVANSSIATIVANDPAGPDPQGAVITLTKALGNTDVTATFPGGFVCTGNLNVIAGAAVGATMTMTGPGLVPDA
jgi:hypothetical protein